MLKNVKAGLWEFLNIHFLQNRKKLKGNPLETLKILRQKVSQSRNNMYKKIFGQGRDSNPRLSAWQTSKILTIRSRRSYISVAVSGSQLIKLIRSVTSLFSKKVTTIVCVFLRKAPTKKLGVYDSKDQQLV